MKRVSGDDGAGGWMEELDGRASRLAMTERLSFCPNRAKRTKRSPLRRGAGDETRTRHIHLGKVALYRMSYARDDISIVHEIKRLSSIL